MEHNEHVVESAKTAMDGEPVVPRGEQTPAETVAPAAGGVAGAVAGGTAGTLVAGPVGTIIGAIAGAVGGWWLGAAARRGVEMTPEDESWYRAHYDAAPRHDDRGWERARPAYELGHAAGANPDYAGRPFTEIEEDLQHGWRGETRATYGDWSGVRELARAAYDRRARASTAIHTADDIGTSESHRRPPFADPLPGLSGGPTAPGHPAIAGDRAQTPDAGTPPPAGPALPHPPIGPHGSSASAPPRHDIP